VAALAKAWTVFARSNSEIAVSNPNQGMNVFVCVVLCVGNGLVTLLCVQKYYETEEEPKAKQMCCRAIDEW
jgi:hypothetical protein